MRQKHFPTVILKQMPLFFSVKRYIATLVNESPATSTLYSKRSSLCIKVYQGWRLQRSGPTDPPKVNGRKFAPTASVASKFRLGNIR